MEKVILKSDFTKDDFIKISLFNIYFRKPIMFILSILVFILGIITLFPIIPFLFSPIFGTIFFVYPLIVFAMALFKINKSIKLNKLTDPTYQTVTIDDEGIYCKKYSKENNFSWADIKEIYETKNYIILYTSKTTIVGLPKRNITSDELYYIRNIVVNKLSSKNYRIKK